ncbi:MAG: TrmH family RNA methyltransferase [bacterium]|nr:TrmH family RNA methyltransferase [bacterium]
METSILLIADNIRSLHNVGSIFRTADAFGVAKIYLCGYTALPIDRMGQSVARIAKTALGAEKIVPWEKARQTWRLIEKLKKDGVYIVALENNVPGAVSIREVVPHPHGGGGESSSGGFAGDSQYQNILDWSPRNGGGVVQIALILGNEVSGISKNILKRADAIVQIPMHGKKESLNVSVACGVALYAMSTDAI